MPLHLLQLHPNMPFVMYYCTQHQHWSCSYALVVLSIQLLLMNLLVKHLDWLHNSLALLNAIRFTLIGFLHLKLWWHSFLLFHIDQRIYIPCSINFFSFRWFINSSQLLSSFISMSTEFKTSGQTSSHIIRLSGHSKKMCFKVLIWPPHIAQVLSPVTPFSYRRAFVRTILWTTLQTNSFILGATFAIQILLQTFLLSSFLVSPLPRHALTT